MNPSIIITHESVNSIRSFVITSVSHGHTAINEANKCQLYDVVSRIAAAMSIMQQIETELGILYGETLNKRRQ